MTKNTGLPPSMDDLPEKLYTKVFQIRLGNGTGIHARFYDAANPLWPLAWHVCQVFLRNNPQDANSQSRSYLALRDRLEELAVLGDALREDE